MFATSLDSEEQWCGEWLKQIARSLAVDGFTSAPTEPGAQAYSLANPPPHWERVRELRGDALARGGKSIDRSLKETKGEDFLLRLKESLPKVPSSMAEVASAISQGFEKGPSDVGATEEETMKIYTDWATRVRFEYCDLSIPPPDGKKPDQDKEMDHLLEEVSDLIETLASYQRNRHLSLPTSQDRYSADPINGDMLRNGAQSQQPSEEELTTYQMLKMQLGHIIQTLPPYAVARLNSDKLAELSVSTKIEVRAQEYRGVMEEDEPSRLKRQASMAAG